MSAGNCDPLSNAKSSTFIFVFNVYCKRQDKKENQSYLTFGCINATIMLCLFFTDKWDRDQKCVILLALLHSVC